MNQQIEQRITAHMKDCHVPGLAFAIVKNSNLIYHQGFGVTGVEDYALPVTIDTLFCIGSTTKPLTGTTIMRLVERGLLDLDTPISHYLHWLKLSEPGSENVITLRHLLSHTSGLPSAYTDYGSRDPHGLGDFIRQELPTCRFIAPPGKIHSYSNAGLDLAGYIAEVVSGKVFPLLVRDEVFIPLNMQRSTFDRNVATTYPLALPHERGEDGKLRVEHRLVDNTPGNPAGFAISTVRDLVQLATMFLNEGRVGNTQFLKPETIREMHSPQADLYNMSNGRKYGLTFYVDLMYKGKRTIQHGGMMMSYACRFVLFPEENAAVVALTNWSEDFWPVVNDVMDIALSVTGKPFTPSRSKLETWLDYEGEYINPEYGMVTVIREGEQLCLQFLGRDTITLDPIEGGLFYGFENRTSVGFLSGENHPVEYVIIEEDPFQRVTRDVNFKPDIALLEQYAGQYATVSTFEGAHYMVEFEIEDGNLFVIQYGVRAQCFPLTDKRFVSQLGVFEFQDDAVQLYNSIIKQRIK
jgi:CubicO group peptidase (beta-lactamase class C family)